MDLHDAPVTALARRLRLGELKSVDLLEAHIARIEAVNPRINGLVADREHMVRRLLSLDPTNQSGLRMLKDHTAEKQPVEFQEIEFDEQDCEEMSA